MAHETRRGVVAGRRGDPGRNAAQRLHARNLVRAAEQRAADPVLARLDQVVEAESDAAVLADPDGRRRVSLAFAHSKQFIAHLLEVDR